MRSKLLPLLIVVALLALAYWGFERISGTGQDDVAYRTAKVERGAIASSIASTGKLSPVITVQVGSQVSGTIAELRADFNSTVTAGELIARLDPETFSARVDESRAEVEVARAALAVQQAALNEVTAEITSAQAALTNAEQDLARKQALLRRQIASQSTVDEAVAARDQSRARLAAARAALSRQRAQIENARAQVMAREVALKSRELDVRRTAIVSPVDGVVISRNVDVGQTVAASLQAPVLFEIARDLRQMQVEASVDEADIGRVTEGQAVSFTVDAFPARSFRGTVSQVRKAPTEVQNVVTYTVVVAVDNPDLALLPGMTANVTVIVGERKDVLRVPNAALRFKPPGVLPDDDAAAGGAGSASGDAPANGNAQTGRERLQAMLAELTEQLGLSEDQQQQVRDVMIETGQRLRALRESGTPAEELRAQAQALRAQARPRIEAVLNDEQKAVYRRLVAGRAANPVTRGRVWVVAADGKPSAVPVTIGLTDGSVSELVRGELADGDAVIVGVERGAARASTTRPFGF